MILLIAATEMEASPLAGEGVLQPHELFITGVGPLETAVRLTRRLCEGNGGISLALNFGVAGAYPGSGAVMLDLCLAESEVMGDFGICYEESVAPFAGQLAALPIFFLDPGYLAQAGEILASHGFSPQKGAFVTVNGVTATARRGAALRDTHKALCENMEGGAVARVCAEFGVPCLEVRCVSNLVEERNPDNWQLAAAAQKCGQAVSLLVEHLHLN